jgi:cysteine-rich repeat protein
MLSGCPQCAATNTGTICIGFCDAALQQFSTISGCSTCSNAAGLFLNQAGNGCAICEEALLNCAECEAGPDGTVCVGCNIGEQKFIFPGNNFCTRCFNEENFYVNADGIGCSFCDEAISGCESCYAGPTGTLCSQCEVGHPSCILDTCGDVLEAQEGCDDGNVKSGDGCSSACAV